MITQLFFALSSLFAQPNTHTLTVQIENVPSGRGQLMLILFNGEEGFPSNTAKAYSYSRQKVDGKKATVTFKDVAPGTYAVAVLHDENLNGQMDTNFMGLPKEGYGFSNDASITLGPPRYQDAKFEMKGNREITINIRKMF